MKRKTVQPRVHVDVCAVATLLEGGAGSRTERAERAAEQMAFANFARVLWPQVAEGK